MLDTDYGNEYANILEVLLWPSVSDEISAVHRDHVKIQSALLSCLVLLQKKYLLIPQFT